MHYQLESGVDNVTGRKIKTAGITLLIAIGLPTMAAVLNKIDPFLLPSVKGASTSQTSTQEPEPSSAKTEASKPAAVQSEANGTSRVTGVSSPSASSNITSVGYASSGSVVPAVGGYGSGPVAANPNLDPTLTPTPVPDTGGCLCPLIQGATEPVKQTITPVTETVSGTVKELGL